MTEDERWQGIAVYGIYLVALFTGVPFLIGVILAYLFKGNASPAAQTHFEHQIGLFWRFFLGNVVNGALFAFAMAMNATVVLAVIGIPLMVLTGIIFVWLWIMILTRSVRGISRLNAFDPYPIPAGFSL